MQVLTEGNRECKGVIVLSAYKSGGSFAVLKGVHFRMDVFNVSAKL